MSARPNHLLSLWLLSYGTLSYAATTFAQDVAAYDWLSLIFAALAGLLGGVGRTILTLMSDRQFVGNLRWLLVKDLIVALIGGGFAYLCVEGYNDWTAGLSIVHLPRIDRGFRVLIVVLAGASRGRWLGVIDRLATAAIDNARHRLRGNAAAEPPTSAAVPLESKP